MKKIVFTLMLITFLACESPPKTAGFVKEFPGVTYTIGTDEAVDVWKKYIDYHNQKDLEGIAQLNHPDISIYAPDGSIIKGSDTHISFLKEWYASAKNITWDLTWATAVKSPKDDGQWVLSGMDQTVYMDTLTDRTSPMVSAYIKNNQVVAFYVKTAKIPSK